MKEIRAAKVWGNWSTSSGNQGLTPEQGVQFAFNRSKRHHTVHSQMTVSVRFTDGIVEMVSFKGGRYIESRQYDSTEPGDFGWDSHQVRGKKRRVAVESVIAGF